MNTDLIHSIFEVSSKERKTLLEQAVKLQEEVGELSAAILVRMKLKGSTKTTEEAADHVLEESCDCMLMIMSIMKKNDFTIEQIEDMLAKKLVKWKKVSNIK